MHNFSLLLSKAHQLFETGDLKGATTLYSQVLAIDSSNLAALNNLSTIYLAEKHYQESARLLKKILTLDPTSLTAHSNLGFILLKSGKYLEAAEHIAAALKKAPEKAHLWNDLANAFHQAGLFSDAAKCYQKAVKIDPDYIESYLGLGEIAVKEENCVQKAIGYFLKALSLNENNTKAHYELSRIYYLQTCQFEQAVYHARRALAIKPDFDEAKITLAEILLKQGNFSEGFPLFDQSRHLYIDKQTGRYKFFQLIPRWNGEIFSGKRLIIGEDGGFGGFGDMLLFARYIPLVKQRGGQVVLPVKNQLYRLFQSLTGVDEFLLPSKKTLYPEDFDLQIPFVSLPVIFTPSVEAIPATPYLSADNELTAIWKKRINDFSNTSDSTLKVGLAWACNPHKDGYPEHRTCTLQTLAPLFQLPQVTYYSLQIGEASAEIALFSKSNIIDLTKHIEDFADTAAFINNLDLVITVDTALAHLAGATGRPVWLILSFVSAWYWLINRTDSPWYPTMRIFQSQIPGDWGKVIEEVSQNLQKTLQDKKLLLK